MPETPETRQRLGQATPLPVLVAMILTVVIASFAVVTTLQSGIDNLSDGLASMQSTQESIGNMISSLASDVSVLNSQLTTLSGDLADLMTDVEAIEAKLDLGGSFYNFVNGWFGTIQTGITDAQNAIAAEIDEIETKLDADGAFYTFVNSRFAAIQTSIINAQTTILTAINNAQTTLLTAIDNAQNAIVAEIDAIGANLDAALAALEEIEAKLGPGGDIHDALYADIAAQTDLGDTPWGWTGLGSALDDIKEELLLTSALFAEIQARLFDTVIPLLGQGLGGVGNDIRWACPAAVLTPPCDGGSSSVLFIEAFPDPKKVSLWVILPQAGSGLELEVGDAFVVDVYVGESQLPATPVVGPFTPPFAFCGMAPCAPPEINFFFPGNGRARLLVDQLPVKEGVIFVITRTSTDPGPTDPDTLIFQVIVEEV